ncbi:MULTISPECIES: tripartite tricarboxylate transporter TctB family protein [Brachybacterium]|uniref:Tricarboxylic transport membrane protein n=1 Tax=Brachybacterium fresconis TaxID=173363 RepID=A0ABS4YLR8_9MICO|nr:tripartite tricarboxylate transporter TctB family protein [Brachybacterium sp.]MBP2409694.1 putative tricarboxylic transport membrane protein [Brachybacterium fresconis]MDN5685617.1 tripartite tricarboxylate transporter TctB family protein [Brachybacterium sp.]
MTSSETGAAAGAEAPAGSSLPVNLVIGAAAVLLGGAVIPYGASMPYIREGIPGPGLFPMMIGGLLVLFGALVIITSLHAARRRQAASAPSAEAGSVAVAAADEAGSAAPEAGAVLDTDIGSDGPRRWINGAVLMGGIVFFVLAAEPLGFPLTMAILVFAIVFSLRARWWVALLTAVLSSVGLWAMFELGLMVQLPDGIIQGF